MGFLIENLLSVVILVTGVFAESFNTEGLETSK